MRTTTALLTTVFTLAAGPPGCRDSDHPVTRQGLGEENRVLRGSVADLKATSAAMKAERKDAEDALRRDHGEQLTRLRDLHSERVAQLEGELAALRLELGAAHRERLALKTTLDRRPRVDAARRARSADAVALLGAAAAAALGALGVVSWRYRSLRHRLSTFAEGLATRQRTPGG